MSTLYFKVKQGLQVGNVIINESTGNITGLTNSELGNLATANYFSGNGSLLSSINGANVTGQVGNALVAGTVYSNSQPNITSLGTLSSLTVTANVSAGNLLGNGYYITNINGSNVTGQVANALVAGTVYTAAQPNITSVGTLASLSVTANVSAGNISATGLVSGATLSGSLTTAAQPNITSVGTLSSLDVTANVTAGNISSTGTITSSGNVTAPYFIGNVVGNISGTITVPGNDQAVLYNQTGNASASDNLKFNYNTNVLTLVGNLTTGNANLGNLAVANYFSGNGSSLTGLNASNLASGTIPSGILGNSTLYIGTTSIALNRSSGSQSLTGITSIDGYAATVSSAAQPNITSVGTLSSLTVTGNITSGNASLGNLASANYISGTLTTQAQPNITSVGTLMGLGVTGNIDITGNINATGNLNYNNVTDLVIGDPLIYIGANNTGNIYDLGIVASYNDGTYYHTGVARNHLDGTWGIFDRVVNEPNTVIDWSNGIYGAFKAGNITAGNISGANLISANYITGTLTTQAQPNITSVGTLNGVTATGTVNLTGASNVALGPVGNVHIGGGSSGYLLSTDGSGTLSFIAPPSTTGITNGTSNVAIPVTNGNVNTSVGGVANVMVVTSTGANITGTFDVSGNLTAGNIGGANLISASYFSGNGSLLSAITGGNVTGQVGNALVAGTVYTAAQPNITSVGTLSSLSVTANVSAGNLLGNGYYLSSINGSNVTGQVSNALVAGTVYTAAQPNITSVGTLSSLSVTANVSAGNISGGNLVSASYFSGDGGYLSNITGANVTGTVGSATTAGTVTTAAQPNITSVGTLASLSVTGNITSGNASLGNLVTANYFSGSGNLLSNIQGANVSGTVSSATSATTAGTVTTAAQPNITSVGTLTSVAVTGNATVGNVVINGGILSNRTNVSVSTNTVIDEFSPSSFRSAKYVISASGSGGYQSVETLLVHDGTNSYITIYGSVCSNATVDTIDITSNINGISGNVTLYATQSGSSTLVNLVATYLKT